MPTPEVVISDLVVKQAAAQAATGATITQIAASLGISKYHVKRIMQTPKFKAVIKDIGDEAVTNAKQVIRSKTGELAQEVSRVLKERLEDNDLEAVKVALKIIGFDSQETERGDTNIVVQLPGIQEKTVTAEFKEVEVTDADTDTGL